MSRTVVIDTETTGLGRDGRDDAIVAVGFAWCDDAGQLTTWEALARPAERYIVNAEDRALSVNGLTREAIRRFPADDLIAALLRDRLDELSVSELRSFNVAFDRPFLERPPWSLSLPWGQCIMLEATPEGARWPTLIAACVGREIDTAGPLHNAAHDSRLAYLLMEALALEHGAAQVG